VSVSLSAGAVARCPNGDVAIRYLLPVLAITLHNGPVGAGNAS